MWRWHPENVRRKTWESLVEATKEACRIADRHEVTLAFEPEINNVVNSVAKARRLLDEVDSPWLKVVIDPANLIPSRRTRLMHFAMDEILNEAFDWLGPDIVLAHAKDPVSTRTPIDEHCWVRVSGAKPEALQLVPVSCYSGAGASGGFLKTVYASALQKEHSAAII